VSAPSREFMIQQAVLNAIAIRMPATVKADGAAGALKWKQRYFWDGATPDSGFVNIVAGQFHDIAKRHQQVAV